MNATPAAITRRESRISAVINMALSAAFFLGAFGARPRPLTVAAPDSFALDFLPQSLAICFFAGLVPALLVSNKRRKGLVDGLDVHADPARKVVARAFGFALLGLGLAGIVIIVLNLSGVTVLPWATAFAIKAAYGAVLGLCMTRWAVRSVLRS